MPQINAESTSLAPSATTPLRIEIISGRTHSRSLILCAFVMSAMALRQQASPAIANGITKFHWNSGRYPGQLGNAANPDSDAAAKARVFTTPIAAPATNPAAMPYRAIHAKTALRPHVQADHERERAEAERQLARGRPGREAGLADPKYLPDSQQPEHHRDQEDTESRYLGRKERAHSADQVRHGDFKRPAQQRHTDYEGHPSCFQCRNGHRIVGVGECKGDQVAGPDVTLLQTLQHGTGSQRNERQTDDLDDSLLGGSASAHDEDGQDQVRRDNRRVLNGADQTNKRRRNLRNAVDQIAWPRHAVPLHQNCKRQRDIS